MFQSGKFLQSKQWAEFQKTLGRKVFFIDGALVIKMPLMLGLSYLYCPKGMIFSLEKIKSLAKNEKAIFLRAEPINKPKKPFIKTKNIQPACTQMLNLTKTEKELLGEMKQKTRYNIRLAEKKGVKIINNQSKIKEFYNLLQQTAKRQSIKLHSKKYYEKLAEFNKIFIAYYNDKPIAGAMINFYDDTATYLHGGSTQEHKQVMAPYLLHWEIIKYAKSKGIKYYDWWGIDEKHWPGITRFKKSFKGDEICAPGTYDLPTNKIFYFLYKTIRRK